ncbi:MAG: metal-sensitive transcriptional regulator [Thermoflexales bacterium]|nr:metal-sensitive transcriptional regulator [Thermoflexales bacterium]
MSHNQTGITNDLEHKAELLKRLNRLEGQVRGVNKMVEQGRSCHEIIQQLSAVRAAAHQASLLVARAYARECLAQAGENSRPAEAVVDELIQVLAQAT